MKSIIKEILIILLMCLAICLILCVIFYNYIPINKVVPSKVEAYTTSNTVKEEINEEIVEYPKQNVIFEITDSDLTLYKKTQSYNPGKSNPFADVTSNNVNTNTTQGNTTTGGTSTNKENNGTVSNTEKNTNSTGTFDTKLK